MWGPGTLRRGHWSHVGDVWAKGLGWAARVAESSASRPPAIFSRPLWAGEPSTHRSLVLPGGCAQAPGSRAGQTPPGAGSAGGRSGEGVDTHARCATWGRMPSWPRLSPSAWLALPSVRPAPRLAQSRPLPEPEPRADSRLCPWLGSQRPPPLSSLVIPQSPGPQGCMVSPYLSHYNSICTWPCPRSSICCLSSALFSDPSAGRRGSGRGGAPPLCTQVAAPRLVWGPLLLEWPSSHGGHATECISCHLDVGCSRRPLSPRNSRLHVCL